MTSPSVGVLLPYKEAVLWQLELPLLYLTEWTAERNGNLGDVRQFSGRYLKVDVFRKAVRSMAVLRRDTDSGKCLQYFRF
jgi:hypothetical protein